MKVAISIFTLAIIAAASSAVLPSQKFGVTKKELDDLLNGALVRYLKKVQVEGVHFGQSPLLLLELKDNKLGVELMGLDGQVTQLPTYELSSTLTDKELGLFLNGVFKRFQTKGHLRLTGSVEGKPVEQTGDVVMSWSDVYQNVSLNAVYDATSVTVTSLDFTNNFSVDEVKVSGFDVEGVTEQELEEAVLKATNQFVHYVDSAVHQMDWVTVVNQFNKGKTLDQVYYMLKLLLT